MLRFFKRVQLHLKLAKEAREIRRLQRMVKRAREGMRLVEAMMKNNNWPRRRRRDFWSRFGRAEGKKEDLFQSWL